MPKKVKKVKGNRVLPKVSDADQPSQSRDAAANRRQDVSRHARFHPDSEPEKHESGTAHTMGKQWSLAGAAAAQGKPRRASAISTLSAISKAKEQQKDFQHWDLGLIIDSDHENKKEAKEEIDKLFRLLKKEGVQLSTAMPLEDDLGWEGKVLALATATQAEFEEEAELMGMQKPLILPENIAHRFGVGPSYGRVTAPFAVFKRESFHKSPFVIKDKVMTQGTERGQDNSGLEYFSYVERQFLLEHMIEHRIRQLIAQKHLSSETRVLFFPLHEPTGEEASHFNGVGLRERLQQQWATPLRWQRYWQILRLWGSPSDATDEPLDEIRNYFGSQIAMYVAFLSFYTRWLVYPALVGLFFQVWSYVYGFDNFGLIVVCVGICLWAALFIKFWERKAHALSYSWFTHDPLSFDPKVRREFYIEMDRSERGKRGQSAWGNARPSTMMSGVGRITSAMGRIMSAKSDWTDEKIQADEMKAEDFQFPILTRVRVVAVSVSVVFLFVATAVIIFVYLYLINIVAAWTNCEYGVYVGSVIHACLIVAVGMLYRKMAVVLNDWENHRTEEEYENNFILKVFLFEFVNNFLSMIWIAFLSFRFCTRLEEIGALVPVMPVEKVCLLDGVQECETEFRDRVIFELQIKLATLFLTRLVISNIIESGILNRLLAAFIEKRKQKAQGEEEEELDAPLPEVKDVQFAQSNALAKKYSKNFKQKSVAPAAPPSVTALASVSKSPREDDEADEDAVTELATAGRTPATKPKTDEEKAEEAQKVWKVLGGVWQLTQKIKNEEDGKVGGYGWWVMKGRKEAMLPTYGDMDEAQTVDDYNELVMQFAFVCLFGVAFPVIAMIALISNLVEMVVDSKKLCFHLRRPFAARARGIPKMWLNILKCVTLFGVVTNIVIVLTNSSIITDWLQIEKDGAEIWTATFVGEHMIILLIVLFWLLLPNEPRSIVKLQILSRRIQRAILIDRLEREEQDGPPRVGAPTIESLPLAPVFNRPDLDDDEDFYYIPAPRKKTPAKPFTARGARRRSST